MPNYLTFPPDNMSDTDSLSDDFVIKSPTKIPEFGLVPRKSMLITKSDAWERIPKKSAYRQLAPSKSSGSTHSSQYSSEAPRSLDPSILMNDVNPTGSLDSTEKVPDALVAAPVDDLSTVEREEACSRHSTSTAEYVSITESTNSVERDDLMSIPATESGMRPTIQSMREALIRPRNETKEPVKEVPAKEVHAKDVLQKEQPIKIKPALTKSWNEPAQMKESETIAPVKKTETIIPTPVLEMTTPQVVESSTARSEEPVIESVQVVADHSDNDPELEIFEIEEETSGVKPEHDAVKPEAVEIEAAKAKPETAEAKPYRQVVRSMIIPMPIKPLPKRVKKTKKAKVAPTSEENMMMALNRAGQHSRKNSSTPLKRTNAIKRKTGWFTEHLKDILRKLKTRSQTSWRVVKGKGSKLFKFKRRNRQRSRSPSWNQPSTTSFKSESKYPLSEKYILQNAQNQIPPPYKLNSTPQMIKPSENVQVTRNDTIVIKSLDFEDPLTEQDLESVAPLWDHYLKAVVAKRIAMNLELAMNLRRQETMSTNRSINAKETLLTSYVQNSDASSTESLSTLDSFAKTDIVESESESEPELEAEGSDNDENNSMVQLVSLSEHLQPIFSSVPPSRNSTKCSLQFGKPSRTSTDMLGFNVGKPLPACPESIVEGDDFDLSFVPAYLLRPS